MIKKTLTIFGILFFFLSESARASDELKVDYDLTYVFIESGESEVTHKISLTNRATHVYPDSFQLKIKGQEIKHISWDAAVDKVSISSSSGELNSSLVDVKLKNPAIGKGNSTIFTLTYSGPTARKVGQIWDLVLGKLGNSGDVDSYEVHLQVPPSFGNPAYMSPPAASVSHAGYDRVYDFTKDLIGDSGVIAGFGNFQTLNFNLTYHLQADQTVRTETIALPPDTYLQRVFYDTIDPKPEKITTDSDGNWLAGYTVKPGRPVLVVAKGQVHLLGQPVSPSRQRIEPNYLSQYTKPTSLWPATDPKITALVNNNSNPKSIFDYVVSTLSYDYKQLSNSKGRKGALNALSSPQTSICTDYSDLFVSLMRASGIPAREHQGFALQSDPKIQPLSLITDVLHSWPEYWDKEHNVWRSVDPTWTDTTGGSNYFDGLDLSHFTFAIHGQDPTNPLPAGFYKSDTPSKDVSVEIGEYRDFFSVPPQATWHLPFALLPFLPLRASVEIKNSGGSALYDTPIKLTSNALKLEAHPTVIQTIPPFSSVVYNFQIKSGWLPFSQLKDLKLSLGSHLVAYNIPDTKFYFWYALIIISISACLLLLAGIAYKAWHLYIQRRKR